MKPSFLRMRCRCGWAAKDGQELVLAVEPSREGFDHEGFDHEGFDWALANAGLSHCERGVHPDPGHLEARPPPCPGPLPGGPERDLHLNRLPYRLIQLGSAGEGRPVSERCRRSVRARPDAGGPRPRRCRGWRGRGGRPTRGR
ncbi:DUF4291 family protein [Streptomyces poriferorum]|uniref:DUF4291 family protein n=1 Tax=Streptomyces poriferorum TaxID=2798799 RepID=UPI003531BDB1